MTRIVVLLAMGSAVLAGCGAQASRAIGRQTGLHPRPSALGTHTAAQAGRTRRGTVLVYRAHAVAGEPLNRASLRRTVERMRKRVAALGVPGADIGVAGIDEISVSLPNLANSQRAEEEVGQSAQLSFYNWEPDVIGPNGVPEQENAAVTGGVNAGAAKAGLTYYEAVRRAMKRPAELRMSDTTWEPGCRARQSQASSGPKAGCIYGEWYLLDRATKSVLRGPAATNTALTERHFEPARAANVEAVRINPGTVVIRARPVEGRGGNIVEQEPNRFYVLKDEPLISGAELVNARQMLAPMHHSQAAVRFGFTEHAARAFERLTRQIAIRGMEAQLPGVTRRDAEQHFAIVLDEQLIAAPRVDYAAYPEGMNPANSTLLVFR